MLNKEAFTDNIFFEELHLKHINLLIDLKSNKFNSWFYKMAIINTFDDLKSFLINLEKIKTKCIIAIQKNKIIGFLYTFPLNQNKTCIKINTPNLIDNNYLSLKRSIILELIRKSIINTDLKTSSWLINSEINNLDLISCARELGFQPLQEIKLLSKEKLIDKNLNKSSKYFKVNNFVQINKTNIQKVLNFVRSNESISIRNILDFNQKDIYKRNGKFCGCILNDVEIIFTILKDINYTDENVYSFTSGPFLDSRIKTPLKLILEELLLKDPKCLVKTYSKDKELLAYLLDLGFYEVRSELILVRNNLIKREIKEPNKINKSLGLILDKINPQGSAYPSPFPIDKS